MTGGAGPLETARHETIDGEARQVIRSPEQVALHLPIAGPTSRMLAYAIDYVAVMALEAGLIVLLLLSTPLAEKVAGPLRRVVEELPKGNAAQQRASGTLLVMLAVFFIIQFFVEWGYFVFWEMVTGGRSPGKAALHLRVMRDGAQPISAQDSLVRNLLRMVDLLPGMYAVGLIAMIASKEGKRLGDLAAGTIVVRLDRPEPAAPLPEGEAAALAVFRFDRAQIERLGPTERALMRQTLRRLEALPRAQADAMLEHAVEALRQRIGYPPVDAEQRKTFLQALLRATQTR